jgi:hypothetical protein
MVDSINRWLTHPDENIRAHIVETFGTEEAIKIAFGAGDRAAAPSSLIPPLLTALVGNLVANFRGAGQIPVQRVELPNSAIR